MSCLAEFATFVSLSGFACLSIVSIYTIFPAENDSWERWSDSRT
jgi:hypothetical protein